MFDHKHVYVSLLKHKCPKVKHVSVSCFYSVDDRRCTTHVYQAYTFLHAARGDGDGGVKHRAAGCVSRSSRKPRVF